MKILRITLACFIILGFYIFLDTKNALENFEFIKAFIKNPKEIGAILPSSDLLAEAMVESIDLKDDEYIVEIGAGTGAFTKKLLEKYPANKIFILEINSELAKILKQKFPDAQIIEGDATKLQEILPSYVLSKVSAVVSGIPFRSLSEKIGQSIIQEVLAVLAPNGKIIQFTYGADSSIEAEKFNLLSFKYKQIYLNFPPASVWIYMAKTE